MVGLTGHIRHLERQMTDTLDPVAFRLVVEGQIREGESAEAIKASLRSRSNSGHGLSPLAEEAGTAVHGAEGSGLAPAPSPHAPPSRSASAAAAHGGGVDGLPAPFLAAMEQSAAAVVLGSDGAPPAPPRPNGGCQCGPGQQDPTSCLVCGEAAKLMEQETIVTPLTQAMAIKAAAAGAAAPPPAPALRGDNADLYEAAACGAAGASGGSPPEAPAPAAHAAAAAGSCPPFAVKSTCGKRTMMEDTYALHPNICELALSPGGDAAIADQLPQRIARDFVNAVAAANGGAGAPPQPPAASGTAPAANGVVDDSSGSGGSGSSDSSGVFVERLHFFGVYDGHGGVEASQHCALRLHHHLSRAVQAIVERLEAAADAEVEASGELPAPGAAEAAEATAAAPVAAEEGGSGGGAREPLPGRRSSVRWQPEVEFMPVYNGGEPDGEGGAAAAELLMSAPDSAEHSLAPAPPAGAGLVAAGASTPHAAPVAASAAVSHAALADTAAAASVHAQLAAAADAVPTADRGGASEAGGSNGPTSRTSSGSGDSDASGACHGLDACTTNRLMEEALREAFITTDEEFAVEGTGALVGSTAVVALIGARRVWIANCGDSRAVLSRGGQAIQVTDDHKPDREDETERVEKAGGQVLYWNGHRVMGVLAMSRAIGDHCLRPYVIPEPEISAFGRHPHDEILLLASDGLWDVMTNQEAADLALRSMRRARSKGASRKAAARVAATVLTKAGEDRGSRDNITVVIIDLASGGRDAPPGAQAAAGAQRGGSSGGGGAGGEARPAAASGSSTTAAAAAHALQQPRQQSQLPPQQQQQRLEQQQQQPVYDEAAEDASELQLPAGFSPFTTHMTDGLVQAAADGSDAAVPQYG